jgi:hypothetical protein
MAKTALPRQVHGLAKKTHGVPAKQYTGRERLKLRYAVPNPEHREGLNPSLAPLLAQHRYRTVIRYLSKSKQSEFFRFSGEKLHQSPVLVARRKLMILEKSSPP